MAIVEAVAWVKGLDLRDLQPLDDVISTQELNRQFSRSDDPDFYRSASQSTNSGPRMTFTYEDCTVSINGHRIQIDLETH